MTPVVERARVTVRHGGHWASAGVGTCHAPIVVAGRWATTRRTATTHRQLAWAVRAPAASDAWSVVLTASSIA
jgi:hypothetical protein